MPLDTIGKKARMEALTREMDTIEADIKKLQKNYIFIDTTQPSSVFWARQVRALRNLRNYIWTNEAWKTDKPTWGKEAGSFMTRQRARPSGILTGPCSSDDLWMPLIILSCLIIFIRFPLFCINSQSRTMHLLSPFPLWWTSCSWRACECFPLKFIIFKSHKNLIFQLITGLYKTHHYSATSVRSWL